MHKTEKPKSRLILNNITSRDKNIWGWISDLNEDVDTILDISISFFFDSEIRHTYSVPMITPEALSKRDSEAILLYGRALIVSSVDAKKLQEEIRAIVKSCTKNCFTQSHKALLCYFIWEKENTYPNLLDQNNHNTNIY